MYIVLSGNLFRVKTSTTFLNVINSILNGKYDENIFINVNELEIVGYLQRWS